jgi:predicted DNA-binding ribbon-helix-helix protein
MVTIIKIELESGNDEMTAVDNITFTVLPTAAADRREEKTGLYNLTSTLRYMC